MEKDIKSQNKSHLRNIYIFVFFVISLIQFGLQDSFKVTIEFISTALVLAMIETFSVIISNILPNKWKYFIVFFRFRNSLPGHRCKKLCESDPRLPMNDLKKRWPELFSQNMDESLQNSYWYQNIYLPVKNKPEIQQAHRDFLLYRDAISGLFIFLVFFLIWKIISLMYSVPSLNLIVFIVLILTIFLLCLAGKQSGERMVVNAVAIQMEKR